MSGRRFTLMATLCVGLGTVACGAGDRAPGHELPRSARSVRITMDALHRAGGVPPRWRFTPPPGDATAGRALFVEQRCHTCHTVRGEPFSVETTVGPDLTGMGAHHPPEYFAEAIMNPDAVLVEGPGYIDADGRSTMPSYPELAVRQVADLVAYLETLTTVPLPAHPGIAALDHAAMGHGPAGGDDAPVPEELPAPPPDAAASYFVQVYDVEPGRLAEFEDWFRREGAAAFLAQDGLVRVDTWVDLTRDGPAVASVFAFRDRTSRDRFLASPAADTLGRRFDAFIGPHPHRTFAHPPVYRVAELSTP